MSTYNSGDPNDRSLRKVEKDVLIPQLIRDRTKTEKCVDEVKGNYIFYIFAKIEFHSFFLS